MANPRFCAPKTIAALIPIASPFKFTSGPPEFPGFIAASVWINPLNSCMVGSLPPVSDAALIDLASPEMMPDETVFLKIPSALPIAMTDSPRSILEELPRSTIGSGSSELIFIIATSSIGSLAKTSAVNFFPLSSMTVYSASLSATTCLFVMMTPVLSTMNPEPPPILTIPFPSRSSSGISRCPPWNGRNGASSLGISFSIFLTLFDMPIETTAGMIFLIIPTTGVFFVFIVFIISIAGFIGYIPDMLLLVTF